MGSEGRVFLDFIYLYLLLVLISTLAYFIYLLFSFI